MMPIVRTLSGREAQILLQAEDEGEQVMVVKYEGENEDKKTHLRSAKSFMFESSATIAFDDNKNQTEDTDKSVVITVVGVNIDLSDGQVDSLREVAEQILDGVPVRFNYNYIEPTVTPGRKKTAETKNTLAPSDKPAAKETENLPVVIEETPSEILEHPNSEIEESASQMILEDLATQDAPTVEILNPFGEPLSEADIQYAFDMCDENGDRRITYKEFEACCENLGIEMSEQNLKAYFKSMDADHNHALDYEEFKQALMNVQPDNVGVWEKMLGASALDLQPTSDDPSIDDIVKLLSSKKAEWRERVGALQSFAKHAVQPMKKSKFDGLMRKVREPMMTQLGDRRSIVVRECCIVIAKICLVRQKWMTRWVPRILEVLFEVIRMNVDIMSVSGQQAAKAIIRCVPDDGRKLEILTRLVKASEETHIVVREKAFEYMRMMLEQTRVEGTKRTKQFWLKTMKALKAGVTDAATDVRYSASLAACELYLKNPARTESEVLSGLRPAQRERFDKTLEEYKVSKGIETAEN